MTEYDNTNRGTLFQNNRKEKESHADWTGKLNVDGKDYWISAWVKQGRGGEFFSLSVKPQAPKTDWKPAGPGKASIRKPDPISTGLPPKRSIIPDDMGGDDIPFAPEFR